jgi:hypothetical protein
MSYKQKDYMVGYRQRNKRTVDGWVTKVYGRMRLSSKERDMALPSFTKEELKKWSTEQGLEKLLYNWIEKNCPKNLTPSVDRIDDYRPYSIDNIKLTTWEENNKRGRGSIKVKDLVHSKLGNIAKEMFSKPVAKSTREGKVLAIYPSAREAARQNDTDSGSIAKVCRGEKITHHNYKWSYVTNRQT